MSCLFFPLTLCCYNNFCIMASSLQVNKLLNTVLQITNYCLSTELLKASCSSEIKIRAQPYIL